MSVRLGGKKGGDGYTLPERRPGVSKCVEGYGGNWTLPGPTRWFGLTLSSDSGRKPTSVLSFLLLPPIFMVFPFEPRSRVVWLRDEVFTLLRLDSRLLPTCRTFSFAVSFEPPLLSHLSLHGCPCARPPPFRPSCGSLSLSPVVSCSHVPLCPLLSDAPTVTRPHCPPMPCTASHLLLVSISSQSFPYVKTTRGLLSRV